MGHPAFFAGAAKTMATPQGLKPESFLSLNGPTKVVP
jgi:hypothetical protein